MSGSALALTATGGTAKGDETDEERILRLAAEAQQLKEQKEQREVRGEEEGEEWGYAAVERSEKRKKIVRAIEVKVEAAIQMWWQEVRQQAAAGSC